MKIFNNNNEHASTGHWMSHISAYIDNESYSPKKIRSPQPQISRMITCFENPLVVLKVHKKGDETKESSVTPKMEADKRPVKRFVSQPRNIKSRQMSKWVVRCFWFKK
jgi:hypothetical protein